MSDVSVGDPPAPTLWEDGSEPGRQVVVLGLALALTVAAVDVLLSGRLTLFFDLCFIVVCLVLALRVRPQDFFTVGVAPPLLMLGLFLLLAGIGPDLIARAGDSLPQAVVSGLAHHAAALTVGYAIALAVLVQRQRVLSRP